MGLMQKLFGTQSEKEIKRISPLIQKIESMRPEMMEKTDEELRAKTQEFKKRLGQGETLDDLLPEAFAVVREAARRAVDMEPYPVQLIGGVAAEAFMVLGYFFYEAVLLGVGIGAAGGIAANIGQGAVGIVIAAVLTPLLSHAHEVRELMDKIRGAK